MAALDDRGDLSASDMRQDTEIQQIKEKYGSECRIIKDVGDFKHLVIMKPCNTDVSIKFQLTAGYPDEEPGVVIQSGSFDIETLPDLQDLVKRKLKSRKGYCVIESVIDMVLAFLEEAGLNFSREDDNTHIKLSVKNQKKSSKKAKHAKGKKTVPDEDYTTKMSAMKTADDVINRIQWDDQLSAEDFFIGYIDRFKGIMEKGFSAFSWEDIASVDEFVLAIPKHRIQYFRYKSVIVWDKTKRLDNVFGSTGSNITIREIIDNYDFYNAKEKEKHATVDDQEDRSSDDDIEIDFGLVVDAVSERPGKVKRPTHFVCIPISDQEIIGGIDCVQDAILQSEPRYASCCARPTDLHITLFTLGLDTEDDIAKACQVLHDAKENLKLLVDKVGPLRIETVEHFYDKVIYAKVQSKPELFELSSTLKSLMKTSGFESRDSNTFVPHITILKLTQTISQELNAKTVKKKLYESFLDFRFGQQIIKHIKLCEISSKRQKNGFYLSPAGVSF